MQTDPPRLEDAAALSARLKAQPGLIPVGYDPAQREVTWADLGTYHPYEGRFRDTLATARALSRQLGGPAPDTDLRSPVSALEGHEPGHLVAPTAFIFGTSRCGSTLVARALSRSRRNLVFGEPPLPDQVFRQAQGALPLDPAAKLLRMMGRRRLASHRRFFVKFSSITSVALPAIREAFPEVPCLFLYRDPVEVLVSLLARPPGWRDMDPTRSECPITHLANVVRLSFEAALAQSGPGWTLLRHDRLTAHTLRHALEAMESPATDPENTAMDGVFAYDAKKPLGHQSYQDDRAAKAASATPQVRAIARDVLADVYGAACQSPHNLNATLSIRTPNV